MKAFKVLILGCFVLGVYYWFHTFWPGVVVGAILYRVTSEDFITVKKSKGIKQ